MTYGIISDIHGNLEALEAALEELRGVDAFLCLGDIVGYGPDPGECLDRVRALPRLICVAGNHDLAAVGAYDLGWFNPFARAAVEWTAGQLTPEQQDYLRNLPRTAHVDGATLVHGSLPEEMDYITSPNEARICFDAMPSNLTLIGHSHTTEYYRVTARARMPEQVPLLHGGGVTFEDGFRYLVNPGAIGQPRDGNRDASFGRWQLEDGLIEIRRVAYDITTCQTKMTAAGLPEYLIARLALGH